MMDPPDPPGHPFYLHGDWEVAAHIQIEVLRARGEMTRSSANIFCGVAICCSHKNVKQNSARHSNYGSGGTMLLLVSRPWRLLGKIHSPILRAGDKITMVCPLHTSLAAWPG